MLRPRCRTGRLIAVRASGLGAARLASEPEVSEPSHRLRRHGSRSPSARPTAILYTPVGGGPSTRVERGADARPALVRVRPASPGPPTPSRYGASAPGSVTRGRHPRLRRPLVTDRHRDRTPRIARDVAPLPRARAGLEPERAVQPQGTDRGHMRAAVLVDSGQPGRAGVRCVRRFNADPASSFSATAAQSTWRQPVRLAQIGDLHEPSPR